MANFSVTSIGIVLLILALTYKYIIYPAFLSPLAKIPSAHPTACISPAWIIWKRFKFQNNRTIHAAHQKLGPIVRLGPSEISVNCVDGGIKTVYAGGFEKHDWYPRVFASFGTVSMFTMTGSRQHSARKRMLSNIYSKSFLQTSPAIKVISKTMIYERFLPILHDAATSHSIVDVHDLNQALTMDFVSAYLFGLQSATNFLQDPETRKFLLHNYQCRKPFEFYYQELPSLVTITQKVGFPLIPNWSAEAGEVMENWNLDLCDKAEASMYSTEPHIEPTVYKQLKRSMEKQKPITQGTSKVELEAAKHQRFEIACEMFDQLTAGHETSAVGLTYVLWELSKKPELQKELHLELETLSPQIRNPKLSAMLDELPEPRDIENLKLLDAIIMETLRLHAPIPGIQPRKTPSPSTSLAGYEKIPPNVRVNAQAYSLHRNPEVFPDPERWQPQRWMNKDDTPELEQMRRWFWAFGSGGRMCVGSNLAIQEMKLAVAAIYSLFRTSIVNDDGIEEIDAYTVRPTSNQLLLRFEHTQV